MGLSLLKRRVFKDKLVRWIMLILTIMSLFSLGAMAIGLIYKSLPILRTYPLFELLSNIEWSPMRGQFGFKSFFLSSIYVTLLSIVIAVPISLLTALFLTQRSSKLLKRIICPVHDLLAGIPSVVYGLWGILIIVPWIADNFGPRFVEYTSGYSLMAGGIVLSVMISPLLVSLFIELFSTVPQALKDASTSLGATRWQTSRKVILRKTCPGIIASIVLAVSKAFGETLAVLMVCGNMVGLPHSIFDSVYPLPALIANNYGEMLSLPIYESALMFAALILFVIILVFNALSRIVLDKVEKRFKL